eukprot:PhF_6_TR43406/c6_g5_i1/m.66667
MSFSTAKTETGEVIDDKWNETEQHDEVFIPANLGTQIGHVRRFMYLVIVIAWVWGTLELPHCDVSGSVRYFGYGKRNVKTQFFLKASMGYQQPARRIVFSNKNSTELSF